MMLDFVMLTEMTARQMTMAIDAFERLRHEFGITADGATFRPAIEGDGPRAGQAEYLSCNLYGYDRVPLGRWSGSLNDLLALGGALNRVRELGRGISK